MEPLLNPLSYVLLIGATLGVVLLVFLLRHARGSAAQSLLTGLMAAYLAIVVAFALQANIDLISWLHRAPWLAHGVGVIDLLVWLIGPLHLLYIRTTLEGSFRWRWYDSLHLVPAGYVFLKLLPFYLKPAAAKLAQLVYVHGTPSVPNLMAALCIMLGLGYLLWSMWLLQDTPSQTKTPLRHPRSWLWQFTITSALAWCGFLVLFASAHVGYPISLNIGNGIGTIMVGWLCAIGYLSFGQAALYSDGLAELPQTAPSKKYAHSGLDQVKATAHLARLQHALSEEHIYTQPDLTLGTMAEHLGMTPHHLSQLINEYLGTSFHGLINEHRIARAQVLLNDAVYAHYTMEGIALEVGYKTRSTFYNAFKKHTNLTPTTYKKQALAQEVTQTPTHSVAK